MAVITGIAAGDVVVRLAGSGGAVVAGEAGANDASMIDARDGFPGGGAVTVLADVGGRDVLTVLAGGGGAVVAACATAGDAGVIEDRA